MKRTILFAPETASAASGGALIIPWTRSEVALRPATAVNPVRRANPRPFAPEAIDMRAFSLLLLLALGLLPSAGAPRAVAADAPEPALIARKQLFGNPIKSGAQVSPDGKWMSWLAPRQGVMNVFVAPAGRPEEGFFVTNEKRRVNFYFWPYSSEHILYMQDEDGNENWRIFVADLKTREAKNLTPFPGVRAGVNKLSRKIRDEVLITLNKRDRAWPDLYRLNYKTGDLSLVRENSDKYAAFITDDQFAVRMAVKSRDDGGEDYLLANDKGEFAPWGSIAPEDARTSGLAGARFDAGRVYWESSEGRDTTALYDVDLKTGERKLIAADPKADIGSIFTDPETHEALAYSIDYERTRHHVLDDRVRADYAFLGGKFEDDWWVTSRTEDDRTWLVGVSSDTRPGSVYLYDRNAKSLTKLYDGRPELASAPLVSMHPLIIKARDGLNLVSYLSLPKDEDKEHPGTPDKPLPLVLDVHGGPWLRTGFGYSPFAQWLANRGYAVLSPNFRSSTGFGKAFVNAGDKEWGRKMDDDLLDVVAYAIDKKIADPARIAIMGGSYGGYATLVGLTRDPETYACGIDTVGPSNLEQLLRTIPPYWASGYPQLVKALGDPATPEGQALLKERSPLFAADRIKRPLMVVQGEHDPRVVKAHADEIVETLEKHKIPVTYVVAKNEGHGFVQPQNNLANLALSESFLARCLGGRSEPIHAEELEAATLDIPVGANLIEGYAAAAKAPAEKSADAPKQ